MPPRQIRVSGFVYELFQEAGDQYILHKDEKKVAKVIEYNGARYELLEASSPSGKLGMEDQAEIWLGYADMYLNKYLSSLEGEETDAQKASRKMLEKALRKAHEFTREMAKEIDKLKGHEPLQSGLHDEG